MELNEKLQIAKVELKKLKSRINISKNKAANFNQHAADLIKQRNNLKIAIRDWEKSQHADV